MKRLDELNPVFIDLETKSRVDLKKSGGWNYAKDAYTQLLTVSWSSEPGEFHLWLPGSRSKELDMRWAVPIIGSDVTIHSGPQVPEALEAVTNRPWVAHNAWSFDQLVWEEKAPAWVQPVDWIDSYPLALASGLPGGLNQIGLRLWGEGKYQEGSKLAKTATRITGEEDRDVRDVQPGTLLQVGKYNVQDVRLLRWLWEEIVRTLRLTNHEWDVLQMHRGVNERGVKVDKGLLNALIELSRQAQTEAVWKIGRLTEGFLATIDDLRSRTKMFKWLDSTGIPVGSSLRKEILKTYMDKKHSEISDDEHEAIDEWLSEEEEPEQAPVRGLPVVLKVLELRMAALRITDSKLQAALESLGDDAVVHGLFVYWGAHTGRWAGRRIQVQNLPRPKKGVPIWDLIDLYMAGQLTYDRVEPMLDTNTDRYLTVDDATSGLVRSIFIPHEGHPKLHVADLSNIEARVLAWLADEEKLMTLYWNDGDPYIAMAEMIFGMKAETWPGVPEGKVKLKKHDWRQVGKVVVLGAGYQLADTKLSLYAAAQGVDLVAAGTDAYTCIDGYRTMFPKIAGDIAGYYNNKPYRRGGLWNNLNEAAIFAVREGVMTNVGPVTFEMFGGHLYVTLPSGRAIMYRNARVEKVQPWYLKGSNKYVDSVVYSSPRYNRTQMYGGKWTENIVQGISRDVIAHSMIQVEDEDIPIVLHVHDEGAGEGGEYVDFMKAFTTPPPWLTNFPLDAEGGTLPRYAKSPPKGQKEQVWRNGQYFRDAE